MQGTLVCRKVDLSWQINITNINGPRGIELLGQEYTADECIAIDQLLTRFDPKSNEFSPIFDVLDRGKKSPFWKQMFETTLRQPIQIVNPTTQESHIGEVDLQLCTTHFQLGQSYDLDVRFKHYKINDLLAKQTTSIHDLNGVLRTSLTLLNDLQQNSRDDETLKKQNLTKNNSVAFFQTHAEHIDLVPRQLLPEHLQGLRELATRCPSGFIILADDMLVNLKVLAKKLYVYLTQNKACNLPFKQSTWGNDVIIMDEVNAYGIIFVANGTLADEIIQQFPVRILITDNDMPHGLSGVDLIKAIRERDNPMKIALHTAIEFDSTDSFISSHDFAYIMKGRHDLLGQFFTEALPLSEPDYTIVNQNQGVKFES